MYNLKRLEWHLGDEVICKPRRVLCGLVVRQASLLDYFNRFAVALAKSQDHRASCGVFAFGRPSDSRYVTGPAWADKSINTAPITPVGKRRTALIERLLKQMVHRWKQGHLYKRINPSSALGCFFVLDVSRCMKIEQLTMEKGGLSTLGEPMPKRKCNALK